MEEIKTDAGGSPGDGSVIKPLVGDTPHLQLGAKTLVILAVLIILGTTTGYAIYAMKTSGTARIAGRDLQIIKNSSEEGVKDASTFRDTATGLLKENDGKITDEGSHILVRGDASQNVYLTSSIIDLSKYVDKKVQVWGETYQGRTAGWLMDIGRVKVL
ncbi:MAG: hypothetical protein UY21_C0001G0130 [Microgenomates group bacterium GW2011_GWA1_48_10]|nr:MAG: hypothetical protein UY21_C0001G0130 [Microgenomates group bacterium GW2011_GWA1_48_10]